MYTKLRIAITILCLSCTILHKTNAQGMPSGGGGGGSDRIEGNYKFMPIPYVGYNRSLGFSIGALPMMMFNPVKKDTLSPSSLIGGLGMYTENKTWFMMGFGSFFFNEDKWRAKVAAGRGEVNFQFYLDNPIDIWIPYNTEIKFLYTGIERKIVDKLYGGVNYTYMSYLTSTDILPDVDSSAIHGLGLTLSLDKRGNYYYPMSGYMADIKYSSRPEWIGNKNISNKIEMSINQYSGLSNGKDVIATRLFTGLGIGDLVFNDQFVVGRNDLRGYSQGEFRGNYLITLQSEYRWNFHERFGAVGFFGIATVFKSINEKNNGKILPGIGTGFRFVASKETNFKVGIDVAKGVDDWSLSFMIGEAF